MIYLCSAAVVINLNCDGGICKFEVEGIYVLNRVLPSSSMKFLRFPNAQLVMQQNMVPNLQSIIINDDTDCACKNFHIPQCIKIDIDGKMCPMSY